LRPDADVASVVNRVRRHYDDGCFACGRANPIGLHLDDFGLVGDSVQAIFTPRPEYRGFAGVLHGGIAATALDEIQAWAAILLNGVIAVTGRLDVRYRVPVPTDRPISARGRIDDASDRRLRTSGELLVDGAPVATSRGLYVATEDVARALAGFVPDP
jgi:acyl-coenzyme A thioesterase PaaI-like protein